MKDRTPERWWKGFFRCAEGSGGRKVVFDSLIKYHRVISVSDHTARTQPESQTH